MCNVPDHIARDSQAAESALWHLFPHDIAFHVWKDNSDTSALLCTSESPIGANPERALEFCRGRACAREALRRLGKVGAALAVGPDRSPVWPPGYVGSITHCPGFVGAAAARTKLIAALGFDAEPAAPLPLDVRSRVLHPAECAQSPSGLDMRVIFSAKESIFKAMFPLCGEWLDFRDVIVSLNPTSGTFQASPASRVTRVPDLKRVQGRFLVARGFITTASYLVANGDKRW